MQFELLNIEGLNAAEVILSRKANGENKIVAEGKSAFVQSLIKIFTDPMVLLLLAAAFIYFMSGRRDDAIFLLAAVFFEVGISLYQYSRSKNAMDVLKAFTKPKSKVLREGSISEINSEEICIDDILIIEEGCSINADAIINHSNDFTADESILTAESFAIAKDQSSIKNQIFQGTSAITGSAIARVVAIGKYTELGKIGKSLEKTENE
jgi:Ca2+-transporting ATPase